LRSLSGISGYIDPFLVRFLASASCSDRLKYPSGVKRGRSREDRAISGIALLISVPGIHRSNPELLILNLSLGFSSLTLR
jgi:hypothetical protein